MPKLLTDAMTSEWYDRVYREAGLEAMASVVIRYDEASCHHKCGTTMEWIDFNLDRASQEGLVRAWWDGPGFVGGCPSCGRLIRFRTLGMESFAEGDANGLPRLPEYWSHRATFGASTARSTGL